MLRGGFKASVGKGRSDCQGELQRRLDEGRTAAAVAVTRCTGRLTKRRERRVADAKKQLKEIARQRARQRRRSHYLHAREDTAQARERHGGPVRARSTRSKHGRLPSEDAAASQP